MNKHPKRNSTGLFVGVPFFIVESEVYVSLPPLAKCLLYELCAQCNKANNGYLSLTRNDLTLRGFNCPTPNLRAINALIDVGLITKTRQGGIAKGRGGKRTCSLYALNWYPINEKLDKPLDNNKLPFKGSFHIWFIERTKKVPILNR